MKVIQQRPVLALAAALAGSAMKRAKAAGLRRNIEVVRRNAAGDGSSGAGGPL